MQEKSPFRQFFRYSREYANFVGFAHIFRMNRGKIVLFILGIILTLGAICLIFPEDGINVGKLHLNFPQLSDFLSENEDSSAVTEEITAIDTVSLKNVGEIEALRSRLLADKCAIAMPDSGLDALDRFFDALEKSDSELVRIVYYGDSQLEEDRMSCTLRDSLQARFGGGGVGLLPAETKYTFRVSESAGGNLGKYTFYGEGSSRLSSKSYGPLCSMNRLEGSASFSISPSSRNTGKSRYFRTLSIFAGNTGSKVKASLNGMTDTLASGKDFGVLRFSLPDSTEKVRLSISGRADIYGISLDGESGVSVDNVALRGCSGTIFTAMNRKPFEQYFRNSGTKLIIMQFGGNTLTGARSSKACGTYASSIRRQLTYMKEAAPDADILFIGPSDMATRRGGALQSYPILPEFIDSLKQAAKDCGAAFWDMYSAMGGQNSMVRWAKSSPSLAGPDYIHFTPRGADKMAGILYKAIMDMYDFHELKKKK